MFRSVCNSFTGRCHHTMRSNGPHHRKEGNSTAGGCCSRWDQQLGPITAYKIKTHRHSSKCKVVYWKCKKIFWSTSTVNPKTTEKLQRALESNFKTQMGPKLLLAHLLTFSLAGLCTELCPVFRLCCFRLSKAHVWQLPRVWWSSAELPGLPSGVWLAGDGLSHGTAQLLLHSLSAALDLLLLDLCFVSQSTNPIALEGNSQLKKKNLEISFFCSENRKMRSGPKHNLTWCIKQKTGKKCSCSYLIGNIQQAEVILTFF